MSRKQSGKLVRGNRKTDVERKRDERATRRALAKDRKNRPQGDEEGDEFISFTNQLQALGLKLREVQGDGNCLFRALGDQLEGHSRAHLRLRQDTVQYMQTHRQDFEPFVEDDVPFTQHLHNLSQSGTFAGNDAIVAFARSHQLRVVIHQLNTPPWEINGSEKLMCRELHIAYRYGDHYDSIRRTGDNSESPAHLRIENLNQLRSQVESCCNGRGQRGQPNSPLLPTPEEEDLILNCLDTHNPQVGGNYPPSPPTEHQEADLACPGWWEEPAPDCDPVTPAIDRAIPATDVNILYRPKLSNKQRKEQQRLEKKKRQEERHRQKVMQSRSSHHQNLSTSEPITLIPALSTLCI